MREMQLKRGIAIWLIRAALSALFVSSGVVSAAIIEDERALEAALEDGFYSLAERSIRELLTRDVSSIEVERLQLLLSHALYGQQKYREIKAISTDYMPDERFTYWLACAHRGLAAYDEALEVLDGDQSKGLWADKRLLLKSDLLYQLGRLEEAEGVCLRYEQTFADQPNRDQNQYQLASIFRDQQRYGEAEELLNTLILRKEGTYTERAELALAELYLRWEERTDQAVAVLNAMVNREQSDWRTRLQAVQLLSDHLAQQGAFDEATRLIEGSLPWVDDRLSRVILKRELASLYSLRDQYDIALNWIESAQAEATQIDTSLALQLEKSKLLLAMKSYKEAAFSFQVVLDIADDSALLAAAYFGRAESLWHIDQYHEAAKLYDLARTHYTQPTEQSMAMLKTADAFYRAEEYLEAEKMYALFIEQYPKHEQLVLAYYQLGLTQASIGRRDHAMETMARIQELFPKTSFAQQAALRIADVLMAEHRWPEALAVYRDLQENASDNETLVVSYMQQALLLYRLGSYEESAELFSSIAEEFSNSSYAQQASYMHAFSLYLLGEVDQSLLLAEAFVEEYATSTSAADVLFWLAEQANNVGDYERSEQLFMQIFEQHPEHVLAEHALYRAGRAAFAQSKYTTAIEMYSAWITQFSDQPRLVYVRFSQGDVFSELGEYARAILAYEEVIENFPQHVLSDAALGRIGDCQFALASEQPERYTEAKNAYLTLKDRMSASPELRLESLYKLGRCEEKMGFATEAFVQYMQGVYHYINAGLVPTEANTTWLSRAAFSAAKIQENLGNRAEAISVYDRLLALDIPASAEAARRRQLLMHASEREVSESE